MELLGIVVMGVLGCMGQMLVWVVLFLDKVWLVGGMVCLGNLWVGCDLGEVMGGLVIGLVVFDDLVQIIVWVQVVIDFIMFEISVVMVELMVQVCVVYVIGIIGFVFVDLVRLIVVVCYVLIICVGNMSFGVNLLMGLICKVVVVLGEDWDIEVVEVYYNCKVDVFLGIVLMLGQVVVEGWGYLLEDLCIFVCEGIIGVCECGIIGFLVICGGDVVGEYDVIFVGVGECVVLWYLVIDWVIFVCGVLQVVIWGQDKGLGEYDMVDVFGFQFLYFQVQFMILFVVFDFVDVDLIVCFVWVMVVVLKFGDVVVLEGLVGVGKMYFVCVFICVWQGDLVEDVFSLIFMLVQIYVDFVGIEIWYVDLYCLIYFDEMVELGLDQVMIDSIVLIEWFDYGGDLFDLLIVCFENVLDFFDLCCIILFGFELYWGLMICLFVIVWLIYCVGWVDVCVVLLVGDVLFWCYFWFLDGQCSVVLMDVVLGMIGFYVVMM